jgi:hypothetical protein
MTLRRSRSKTLSQWVEDLFAHVLEVKGPILYENLEAKEIIGAIQAKALPVEEWKYVVEILSTVVYNLGRERAGIADAAAELRQVLTGFHDKLGELDAVLKALKASAEDTPVLVSGTSSQGTEAAQDIMRAKNCTTAEEALLKVWAERRKLESQRDQVYDLKDRIRGVEEINGLIDRLETLLNPATNHQEATDTEESDDEEGQSLPEETHPETRNPRRRSHSTGDLSPSKGRTEKRRAKSRDRKTSTSDELTKDQVLQRLCERRIDPFSGIRETRPYGEDFSRFLRIFERYTNGVSEKIKLDELICRLKPPALEHVLDMPLEDQTYAKVVKSLSNLFYVVETKEEKCSKYRELTQADSEFEETFRLRFEKSYREYLKTVAKEGTPILQDEVYKCNEYVAKIRPALRSFLARARPMLLEDKSNLTWEKLIFEIKLAEKRMPPQAPKQKQEASSSQHQSSKEQKQEREGKKKFKGHGSRKFGDRRHSGQKDSKKSSRNKGHGQSSSQKSSGDAPKCYNCGEVGHMSNSCNIKQKPDAFQPQGNAVQPTMNRRGTGRGRGRGGRGRGSNPQTANVNVTQNYAYDDEGNPKPPLIKFDQGSVSSLRMADMLGQSQANQPGPSNHGRLLWQVEDEIWTAPVCIKPWAINKCRDRRTLRKIPRFNTDIATRRQGHLLPPWRACLQDEGYVETIKDKFAWAHKIQKCFKRRPERRSITGTLNLISLKHVEENRWECLDQNQTRCPLLIEGILVEDVRFDTGSQYNTVTLNLVWAMAGRFPSWARALESSTCWCPREKYICNAGGDAMEILGVIRLHVRTVEEEEIPIYWAIYDAPYGDHLMILGTKGLRELKVTMRSKLLGDDNVLVPVQEEDAMATRVLSRVVPPLPRSEMDRVTEETDQQPIRYEGNICWDMPEAYSYALRTAVRQFEDDQSSDSDSSEMPELSSSESTPSSGSSESLFPESEEAANDDNGAPAPVLHNLIEGGPMDVDLSPILVPLDGQSLDNSYADDGDVLNGYVLRDFLNMSESLKVEDLEDDDVNNQ